MSYAWPGGARLALSLVVNVEEGAEFNIEDGDRGPEPVDELGITLKKPVRNFGNESNYAYGINEGAPRVLGLLDRYGFSATFTAAAVALERAPQVARGIAGAGHEVCAHGYRWAHQLGMSEDVERDFIRKATNSIATTTGTRPVGWLSRYLHTAETRRLLSEEGYLYHMDDFSRDEPFMDRSLDKPMVVLPYALDSNDMKMWNAPALTPSDWLIYARDTFDWLLAESVGRPRMMSLGVHLRIIGRPGRIVALDRFLQHVSRAEGVWIATRRDIAAHYLSIQSG
ncbi:MAG: polysaccharide deacetylase family protein [Gammaproteobacteria bacterium]|jgi:peptidoglycan/xylan/chitin deacetylase (PgdA/CDA1 family)|nr:polysaccharide deacetylase family protein [Gammaproteobacteria bacterium]